MCSAGISRALWYPPFLRMVIEVRAASKARVRGPGSRHGFAARKSCHGRPVNPECLGVERRAGRGQEGGEKNDGEEVKRVSSLDLNEVGEAADFAIEDAELALDFLDLEFEGMSFSGSFGV